jgi:hypothetical protein
MSNNQGLAANFMYVWDAGGPPTPDAQGRFSNNQGKPNSAIPMFQVTTPPANTPPYPDNQGAISNIVGAAQGAIPIKITGTVAPVADAQGWFPTDPTNVNSAIAVYFVVGAPADTPPYPNGQEAGGGATPCYVVV